MRRHSIQTVRGLVLVLVLTSCQLFRKESATPVAQPAPALALAAPVGQLPRAVRPLAYTLELEIVPSRDRFAGRAQIVVTLDGPTPVVWLHGKDLRPTRIVATAGGRSVAGTWTQVNAEGLVLLSFGETLPAGQALLDISYDAPFDRQLQGLFRVDVDGASYAFTQFESVSARKAFPCFDEPVFKTPYDVWLTVPASHAAIANAAELSSELVGELKRVHFAPTKPLPSYLVAFAAGPFDVVEGEPIAPNDVRAQAVPLRGVAVRGQGGKLAYALARTGAILASLERYTGIGYPYDKLDILAVPDLGPGAMENAGAITFREWLLLVDEATAPEGQKRAFASVMAHELAHLWFGDLVTMPWWDDIWLNEAFATWLAARTVAEIYPDHRAEIALLEGAQGAMQHDSRVSARVVRQPIASTHDIANAFDTITYQKGAAVLGMFERWLGAETFRAGLRAYLAAHAHGTATTGDLTLALSQAAQRDVGVVLESFLAQPGVPWVEARTECREDGSAELRLAQSRFLPLGSTGERAQAWRLPVCARYAFAGKVHEACTLLEAAEGALPLEGCPGWLMPNAEAAGYYRFVLAPEDRAKLERRGWERLSARERLAVADSLRAGFEGGRARAEDVFGALATFAEDEERGVATVPMELLSFAREYLLDEAGRPALERHARRLYQPALDRLGWSETPDEDGETKLLRAEVIAFLADVARVPTVRERAARLGRRALGLDGEQGAADGVPEDLRDIAVRLAVEDGDEATFDAVIARLRATNDPVERNRLLAALGSVRDARSVKALALSFDSALKVNEVLSIPRTQLADEHTREAAWAWIEANFDAIVARVSPERASSLPTFAAPFCSEAMASRVEAFFAPRIATLTGGPRRLASSLEALRLCAARVLAHKDGTRAFYAR